MAWCGRLVAAAARTGSLHLMDPFGDGSSRSTAPLADTSLGIAHMAAVGPRLLCGFNRDGYRLHAFTHSSADAA